MIVGIFALLISIGTFWFSIKTIRLYHKVKNWERIEANVLSKEVVLHERYSSGRQPYAVKAEYEFTLENKLYKGNKVHFLELLGGQANNMKSTADNRLALIKDKMLIYVNKDNPNESVMFCEGIRMYYLVLGMGVLSLLIGLVNIFK